MSLLLVLASIAGYLIGWHEGHITGMSPGWIGAILALTAIHFLIEPLRWQVYLGDGTVNRWTNFYHIFSCTALLSYILPAKLGLPLRYWLIAHYQNLSATTVGIYMAIDGVLGLALWAASSLAIGGNLIFWLATKYSPAREASSLGAVVMAGLVLLGLFWTLVKKRWPSWQDKLIIGLSQIRTTQLMQAAILFMLDIAGYVVRHAAILAALSAPFIGWQAIASVTVLSIFAGFLCMLPMGLVGYDVVMILLLTRYGISVEIAVMVPLINRSASLLLSALLGLPSALKLGLSINKKSVITMMSENHHV